MIFSDSFELFCLVILFCLNSSLAYGLRLSDVGFRDKEATGRDFPATLLTSFKHKNINRNVGRLKHNLDKVTDEFRGMFIFLCGKKYYHSFLVSCLFLMEICKKAQSVQNKFLKKV